eukprot:366239-Chlamydomonas_euryale.AAC.16
MVVHPTRRTDVKHPGKTAPMCWLSIDAVVALCASAPCAHTWSTTSRTASTLKNFTSAVAATTVTPKTRKSLGGYAAMLCSAASGKARHAGLCSRSLSTVLHAGA